jgi:hypothetical protein
VKKSINISTLRLLNIDVFDNLNLSARLQPLLSISMAKIFKNLLLCSIEKYAFGGADDRTSRMKQRTIDWRKD